MLHWLLVVLSVLTSVRAGDLSSEFGPSCGVGPKRADEVVLDS